MNIKIMVATHKKYWMPKEDVYLPIQVGAEGKEDFGYIRDNLGDNISIKNPNYCELTAMYWAWKNLSCDYIGLCHYRRYFTHNIAFKFLKGQKATLWKKQDFEKILRCYDIILPKSSKIYPEKANKYSSTIRMHYEHNHYKKDLDMVEEIIKIHYPNYYNTFLKVMDSNVMHFCNSFVMSKYNFDKYCEWLFTILFKLETKIDIEKYDAYQKRIFGFLSERLLNVYVKYNFLPSKIYEAEYSLLKEYSGIKKIIVKIQDEIFN